MNTHNAERDLWYRLLRELGMDPDKVTDEQLVAFARWWNEKVIPECRWPYPSREPTSADQPTCPGAGP